MARLKKKKKQPSLDFVRVARPGIKGLITGVAPEDETIEGAADMWNLRADQLGRLATRQGYRVLHYGIDSGNSQIMFMMPSTHAEPTAKQVISVAGLYGEASTLKFYAATTLKKTLGSATVYTVHGALITNEAVNINLFAIDGVGYFKNYLSGSNIRVCQLPLPMGANMSGVGAAESADGTFVFNKTYRFRMAWYNSITGEEGLVSAFPVYHTVAGVNRKITLSSIPVSSDADEKDDLYRRIYCVETVAGVAQDSDRLIGTIEDNTTTTILLENAPTSSNPEPEYKTAPPTPGRYSCIAFWNGLVWTADDDTIYFNRTEHALLSDTLTNAVACVGGQPLAFLAGNDRLWMWTSGGLYYIPRPVGATSADNITQVKYSDVVIDPESVDTVALCRGIPIFLTGDRVKQINQDGLGPLGPDYQIKKKVGDWRSRRNFAIYDSTLDRYLLFTFVGANSVSFSRWLTRDLYIYNFQTERWERDNYLGLYPTSAMEWQPSFQYRREITLGGAYGVVASIEGGRLEPTSLNIYPYDGTTLSTYRTGTATGGSTTTVADSVGPFNPVIHTGASCAIYRASVDTDGNEYWKYMGIAPVKSVTGSITLNFGHSIGFTVAAGDKYFVGAIPWLIKTPALSTGKHLITRVEVEHAGALSNAILAIPRDTEKETGWMGAETDVLQKRFSDARTGLHIVPLGVHMGCDGPQMQLCGFEASITLSELRVYLTKLKEK